jgi:hypothetical protein
MELQMSIVVLPSTGYGPGGDPKDVGSILFLKYLQPFSMDSVL